MTSLSVAAILTTHSISSTYFLSSASLSSTISPLPPPNESSIISDAAILKELDFPPSAFHSSVMNLRISARRVFLMMERRVVRVREM